MPQERRQMHVHNLYLPDEDLLQLTYFPPSAAPFTGVRLAEDIVAGFNRENNYDIHILHIYQARQNLALYADFNGDGQRARLLGGFRWNNRLPFEQLSTLLQRSLSTKEFIDQLVVAEARDHSWRNQTYGRY